jgi:hypothetical protein
VQMMASKVSLYGEIPPGLVGKTRNCASLASCLP